MYFLSVGFPRWDGYAVYNDPELAIYAFKGALNTIDPIPEFVPIILLAATIAIVIIVSTIALRKGYFQLPKRRGLGEHVSSITIITHARTKRTRQRF
jgi:hypothetical protein